MEGEKGKEGYNDDDRDDVRRRGAGLARKERRGEKGRKSDDLRKGGRQGWNRRCSRGDG